MSTRKAVWILVVMTSALGPALSLSAVSESADAAPGARYRVGMRVRAKRTCTVQGFEVKKGVVLAVVAVQSDDKGKVVSVDLSFSGMTISNVPAQVVDASFSPA